MTMFEWLHRCPYTMVVNAYLAHDMIHQESENCCPKCVDRVMKRLAANYMWRLTEGNDFMAPPQRLHLYLHVRYRL